MICKRLTVKLFVILLSTLLFSCGQGDAAYSGNSPKTGEKTFNPTTPKEKLPLSTQVTLVADKDIIPQKEELVTFGLPLKQGVVWNTQDIQIMNGEIEMPAYVEPGLRWHWADNSLRSVTIQLDKIDMTQGPVIVTITNTGQKLYEQQAKRPHLDGWVSAGKDKADMQYPRIFALHNPTYLAESHLVPPYLAAHMGDDYDQYAFDQHQLWSGNLNFSESASANWLFDRSSSYFKLYMSSGRVEFLKEAILSKQYYFQFVRNDGTRPKQAGGDGCWQRKGVACADGKYIAPQQAKLAWALAGDNSQWTEKMLVNMAKQADLGWNQYTCSADSIRNESFGFTERSCGLTGLSHIAVYEMTGDKGVLKTLNNIIHYLKMVQQNTFEWDKAYGWLPKSGAFTHDVEVHEGDERASSAPKGDTNAQGFSPWMSENIADFLWQTYWITGREDIPEMLRQLGNAIENYGFTSNYDPNTKQHIRDPAFTGMYRTKSCNREKESSEQLYFASAYADAKARAQDDWWPWYTDTHNIEIVLPLSAAYYFENDAQRKEKLQARIDKLIYGWVNPKCAKISSTPRLFNWQHRSNAIRTWDWVKSHKEQP
ncbi:hypothetical protein [Teredinibacter sp. KSP-S5-2]|uniref:hypothetical protein n=1 Tax=Teredinibacter sp. KSP-S5-2 TaxID=3034506 RepID=UPI00293503B6|nr:hypothetical protein [Teredinibacter sp. KSP-S5-2]WNO08392.1 hypothetical protein P5V12_15590 [Teredinibacter sp. KSP-S5-2]